MKIPSLSNSFLPPRLIRYSILKNKISDGFLMVGFLTFKNPNILVFFLSFLLILWFFGYFRFFLVQIMLDRSILQENELLY